MLAHHVHEDEVETRRDEPDPFDAIQLDACDYVFQVYSAKRTKVPEEDPLVREDQALS